jgi:mono/diheme cytochrome c family protein
MNRFRIVALAAFVGWCSALVALSALDAGQAAPGAAGGDQQTRGKALYLDKCSSCHQEDLKGTSESPPLTGDMFWMNWETYTANNLLEQVRTTMPEDNPGSLMRQEYVDIVAYILRFNEVPLTGDLPADADSLKKVIVKMKDK